MISKTPTRTIAVLAGSLLVAVVGMLVITRDHDAPSTPSLRASPTTPTFGHVHGLGVDPEDGQLRIATHAGLYVLNNEDEVSKVGDYSGDLMGFEVVAPDRYYATGHPASGAAGPTDLGLIATDDGGATWQQVSLQGAADFHSLKRGAGGGLWALDGGRLMSSEDGRRWADLGGGNYLDVGPSADDDTRALVTTTAGEVYTIAADGTTRAEETAPVVGLIDSTNAGTICAIGADGRVFVRSAPTEGWAEVGQLPGQVSALLATDETWFAATAEGGLFASSDAGASWDPAGVG